MIDRQQINEKKWNECFKINVKYTKMYHLLGTLYKIYNKRIERT